MSEVQRKAHPREFNTWASMKQRCLNPNARSYRYYGLKGIKICDAWTNSFEQFLSDMGERPMGKTLDRYPNPRGDYEPSNCRWATQTEQNNNRCNTVIGKPKYSKSPPKYRNSPGKVCIQMLLNERTRDYLRKLAADLSQTQCRVVEDMIERRRRKEGLK